MARKKMVAVAGEGKGMALAVVHLGKVEGKRAKACFLLGDAPEVRELASFVISGAAKAGFRRLSVSCPNRAGTVEGLKGGGFKPAFRSSFVYMRRI